MASEATCVPGALEGASDWMMLWKNLVIAVHEPERIEEFQPFSSIDLWPGQGSKINPRMGPSQGDVHMGQETEVSGSRPGYSRDDLFSLYLDAGLDGWIREDMGLNDHQIVVNTDNNGLTQKIVDHPSHCPACKNWNQHPCCQRVGPARPTGIEAQVQAFMSGRSPTSRVPPCEAGTEQHSGVKDPVQKIVLFQPIQGDHSLAELGPKWPGPGLVRHAAQVSSLFSGMMRSKQTTPPPLSMDTSLTPWAARLQILISFTAMRIILFSEVRMMI